MIRMQQAPTSAVRDLYALGKLSVMFIVITLTRTEVEAEEMHEARALNFVVEEISDQSWKRKEVSKNEV